MMEGPSQAACVSSVVDYRKAINDWKVWKASMCDPASKLQSTIPDSTKQSCVVCECLMDAGAQAHIISQTHWAKIWERLASGKGIPSPEDVIDWTAKWVQSFDLDGGVLLFNHITGDQMQQGGGYSDTANSSVGYSAFASSTAVASSAPSSTAVATSSSSTAVHPKSAASWPIAGGDMAKPPVRDGIDYQKALNTKHDWKQYMDPAAQQLESVLADGNDAYSTEPCPICGIPKHGVRVHITSQKHWTKLWTLIGNVAPSVEQAVSWDTPWVERIATPSGDYMFNHLTGEQGLRVKQAVQLSPTAKSATDTREADQLRPFEIDIWLWQQLISDKAAALQRCLMSYGCGNASLSKVRCEVCMCWMVDVVEHLQSADHLSNLRIRMNLNAPSKTLLPSGPWVQKGFAVAGGTNVPVSFNHLTGELIFSALQT